MSTDQQQMVDPVPATSEVLVHHSAGACTACGHPAAGPGLGYWSPDPESAWWPRLEPAELTERDELYAIRRALHTLGHMVRDSVQDGRPSAVWDRQDQANGHAMALEMRLMIRRLQQTLAARATAPSKEAA